MKRAQNYRICGFPSRRACVGALLPRWHLRKRRGAAVMDAVVREGQGLKRAVLLQRTSDGGPFCVVRSATMPAPTQARVPGCALDLSQTMFSQMLI